jgi:xanthine dehydrogenase accessory factor
VYFCREACKDEYAASLTGEPAPAAAATTAVDPVCGMTVAAKPETPHVEYHGETVYFCCEGCRAKFQQEHMDAVTTS